MKVNKRFKKNLTPEELYRVLGFLYLELENIWEGIGKVTTEIKKLKQKLKEENLEDNEENND